MAKNVFVMDQKTAEETLKESPVNTFLILVGTHPDQCTLSFKTDTGCQHFLVEKNNQAEWILGKDKCLSFEDMVETLENQGFYAYTKAQKRQKVEGIPNVLPINNVEAEKKLVNWKEGSYLLHESEDKDVTMVLAVKKKDKVHNIPIIKKGNEYIIRFTQPLINSHTFQAQYEKAFTSLEKLIHSQEGITLYNNNVKSLQDLAIKSIRDNSEGYDENDLKAYLLGDVFYRVFPEKIKDSKVTQDSNEEKDPSQNRIK